MARRSIRAGRSGRHRRRPARTGIGSPISSALPAPSCRTTGSARRSGCCATSWPSSTGLTGTAKRKAVLDAVGLQRAPLERLLQRTATSSTIDLVGRLLEAMQAAARPIKPEKLGPLGRDNVAAALARYGGDPRDLPLQDAQGRRRRRAVGGRGGVRLRAEAHGPAADLRRQLVAGARTGDPFRLGYQLGANYCGRREPIVLLVHLICPRPEFLDRGKSSLARHSPGFGAIREAVAARHRGLGEAARSPRSATRRASRSAWRSCGVEQRAPELSLKDAVLKHLPAVIEQIERERPAKLHAARPVLRDPAAGPAGAGEVARLRLLHGAAHRLRERARRDRRPAARAARHPLPPAPATRRSRSAPRPSPGYSRPFWTFNKLRLHREGRHAAEPDRGRLAGRARLRDRERRRLHHPRRQRPGRPARDVDRAGHGVLRPRRRRRRHDDLPHAAERDEGARRPQDRGRQPRPRALGRRRDGPRGRAGRGDATSAAPSRPTSPSTIEEWRRWLDGARLRLAGPTGSRSTGSS